MTVSQSKSRETVPLNKNLLSPTLYIHMYSTYIDITVTHSTVEQPDPTREANQGGGVSIYIEQLLLFQRFLDGGVHRDLYSCQRI
jgi:hypothetical protein